MKPLWLNDTNRIKVPRERMSVGAGVFVFSVLSVLQTFSQTTIIRDTLIEKYLDASYVLKSSAFIETKSKIDSASELSLQILYLYQDFEYPNIKFSVYLSSSRLGRYITVHNLISKDTFFLEDNEIDTLVHLLNQVNIGKNYVQISPTGRSGGCLNYLLIKKFDTVFFEYVAPYSCYKNLGKADLDKLKAVIEVILFIEKMSSS
jgi:hypothetical protein